KEPEETLTMAENILLEELFKEGRERPIRRPGRNGQNAILELPLRATTGGYDRQYCDKTAGPDGVPILSEYTIRMLNDLNTVGQL
ncbi:unnamed protein product, partial [Rhizophagus irregularis]